MIGRCNSNQRILWPAALKSCAIDSIDTDTQQHKALVLSRVDPVNGDNIEWGLMYIGCFSVKNLNLKLIVELIFQYSFL